MRRYEITAFFCALAISLSFGLLLLSVGCSGSSGSSDISTPAVARIQLAPSVIDSGDRIDVEVFISDMDIELMAIKIRIPTGLSYVSDTSYYEINGRIFDTGPTINTADSEYNYLVYYTSRSTFGSGGNGYLLFVLEGVSNVPEGKVSVDIDTDNPTISNSTEFDVSAPKFDSQSDATVRVGEESSGSSSSSS